MKIQQHQHPKNERDRFVSSISKLDGEVCLVSDRPDIPLQSFSPTQPDLVEDVLAWIHRVVLES